MMGSNNGGGGGGGGGGMTPGMGSPMAGGSDGRHDDEAVLTEFLSSLMDYTPTIPDELVEHYLGRSGFHCPDVRLTRLVAVATQKFISDIASDSLQHCKARVAAPIKDNKSKQPKDRRLVLTMDDLSKALREVQLVSAHVVKKTNHVSHLYQRKKWRKKRPGPTKEQPLLDSKQSPRPGPTTSRREGAAAAAVLAPATNRRRRAQPSLLHPRHGEQQWQDQ